MPIGENMKRSVLITGSCYGTGFTIAEKFAKEGYDIFITGRDEEKAANAAKAISEKFGVAAHGFATKEFDQEEEL